MTAESANTNARRQALIALAGVVLLLWLLAAGRPPRPTLMWTAAYDLGHIPLFGAIAVLLLIASRGLFANRGWKPATHYVLAIGLTAVISLVSEWLQRYVATRDAQLSDALNNLLGALCFLVLAAAWLRDLDFLSVPSRRRWLIVASVLVLAAAMSPLYVLSWHYGMRAAAFPVIADFDSRWQQPFLNSPRADLRTTAAPAGWMEKIGEDVTVMRFRPAPWPGVIINEPYPDWTDYQALRFDVYSELDRPVPVVLHVSDGLHNDERKDRFNRIFTASPGLNEYRVTIDDLRTAPAGREMVLTDVTRMVLFTRPPREAFEVYLSDMWLE